MPQLERVFISHAHADEKLAKALRDALKEIFTGVRVDYSSSKELGEGTKAGGNWVNWVHERVMDCQEALLLLTPQSFQKPWPMWEAGAVAGVAMALEKGTEAPRGRTAAARVGRRSMVEAKPGGGKRVTPLIFRLRNEQVRGPFLITKIVPAEDPDAIKKLLGDWMQEYDYQSLPASTIEATLKEQVKKLLQAFEQALQDTPPPIREDLVDEWCRRLDQLKADKRSSEVRHFHHWIRLMFDGPQHGEAHAPAPWDVRVHLRLGELYRRGNQIPQAVEQLELALRLAPLDIFVMHRLGIAYLDGGEAEKTRRLLDRVAGLDPDIQTWNQEIAGLEGRYWKEQGKQLEAERRASDAGTAYRKARDAYGKALEKDPRSYYLADNVGQLSLRINDPEGARRAYQTARRILEQLGEAERGLYSRSTAVNVALYFGEPAEAERLLDEIRAKDGPSARDLAGIVEGLNVLSKHLAIDAGKLALRLAAPAAG